MVGTDCPTDPRRKMVIAAFSYCSQVKVYVSSLVACASVEDGKADMSLGAGFTQTCKGQGHHSTVWPEEETVSILIPSVSYVCLVLQLPLHSLFPCPFKIYFIEKLPCLTRLYISGCNRYTLTKLNCGVQGFDTG